ncbi:MAG: alginate lyase, partial [Bacteroidota bacterium]
ALDRETDDIGIYNAQYVIVENCLFDDIGQEALHVHRGGRDESTLGPRVTITSSTFDEIGGDKRNQTGSSIRLHGTQLVQVSDCIFDDSKPLQLHLVVGEPIVNIEHSVFSGGTTIEDNGEPYRTNDLLLNLTEPQRKSGNGRPIGTSLNE